MRRIVRNVASLVAAVLVAGCATQPITQSEVDAVPLGTTHESFKSTLTKKAASTLTIVMDGVTYTVDVYSLQTGTRKVTVMTEVWTTRRVYSEPAKRTVPVLADYAFIFDGSGMVYSGLLKDVASSEDETIRQLAPAIEAAREAAQEKK